MKRWSTEQNIGINIFYLIVVSIFIKIGIFPFHRWLIKTMKSFSWVTLILIFSWQKLIPLFIVIKITEKTKIIFKISIFSALILNFFLIKINNSKKIITLSSLVHNSWTFIPLLVLKEISLAYLVSYRLIVLPLIINFIRENIKRINTQIFSKKIKKEVKLLMFSIRGIPPSIGFLIKIIVLSTIIVISKKTIEMFILLIASCVAFLVYSQIFKKYFFLKKTISISKNYFSGNRIKEISWVFIILPTLVWY